MASAATPISPASTSLPGPRLPWLIAALAAGTLLEWYDFYVFGSLGPILASKFYATGTPVGDVIVWLATFAVGFVVRPFGALVFGRVGDHTGRRYTVIVTMALMGLCSVLVGLLPTREVLGPAAGVLLIVLRVVQGLALGGEYGGAATYLAECSPHGRRGFLTSWLQTTATLGLFTSLSVILVTRLVLGEVAFAAWGWRIPFFVSGVLIVVALYLRARLHESPMFARLKRAGGTAQHPLRESFADPVNMRLVALALFGATMGQGVVWYTGQVYALYYLQAVLKVPPVDATVIVGVALVAAAPLFVVTGWLSDKVGRKWIMMAGMLLAVLTYYPIYQAMGHFAPRSGDYNPYVLGLLVFVQVVYAALVYGPIAACLVELFPTRIRYTSVSLPYNIGNGIFGGLAPLIGLSLIQATNNDYAGLWYPIIVALICVIIGALFLPETFRVNLETVQTSSSGTPAHPTAMH
ncbi:MAG: MFS transporter [Anaerolineae bacterium]